MAPRPPQNDAAEARAFRRVFGEQAASVPVTSLKSMIGHCLGAAGAVEAAALALTIARGAIPPTIHHDETDAECALDVVANQAREQRVRCGVSTSLAFGGNDFGPDHAGLRGVGLQLGIRNSKLGIVRGVRLQPDRA